MKNEITRFGHTHNAYIENLSQIAQSWVLHVICKILHKKHRIWNGVLQKTKSSNTGYFT